MNKFTDNLKKVFKSRSMKYGSNSIILIAAVIAIAVVVNMMISPAVLKNLTGKEAIKWDLTPNKLYSIGETTTQILNTLEKDVTIYALYDEAKIKGNTEFTEINELLKKYASAHVKIEYVDTDKNPGFIKSIDSDNVKGISKNDIVFVSGKKVKKLSIDELFNMQFDQQTFQQYKTGSSAEQEFSGAIKYVTSDKTPSVYFLEGHEEKKVDSDYKTVAQYLQRNNYDVKTINLTTEAKVPEDAEMLMIAAPKKDLTTDEKGKINEYLKNGGKAIFAFDPIDSDPELSNFQDVLSAYNVSLNYDIVKENDERRHPKNMPNDILPDVQDSSINSPLDPKNLLMIMPKSRSINILKNQKEWITVTSLMKTSSKAVGELIDKSKGTDIVGPLDLAVAVENKSGSKSSKVLVMGNGSFMSDDSIRQYEQYSINGLYFFLNSMSWLQDKNNDVIIAPKTYDSPRLQMDSSTANIIALLVVVVFPVIIFGFGTYVWMRRRHL